MDTFNNNEDVTALATHYAPENKGLVTHDDDSESGESYPAGTKVGPLNALFMAQKEKYDRMMNDEEYLKNWYIIRNKGLVKWRKQISDFTKKCMGEINE